MSPPALTTDLHTLSLSLPSLKKTPSFYRLLQSSPRSPKILTMKAMGGVGASRDNLDHLQRATSSKMRERQSSSQPPKRKDAQSPPLGPWDRFPTARTVDQMMETMERIFEDPYAYRSASLPSFSSDENVGSYRRGRTPWEIKEREGEYKIRFDMPGMTKKDVKMWVEEKMLIVRAEKSQKEGVEQEEWPLESFGRYNSRIALPDNVEVEKIKAEVKDGVLYITIPKVSRSSKVLDIDVQ